MKFQEFPIPLHLNTDLMKAELECDEVYIRDNKLVIGGDCTEVKILAAIAKHQITQQASKALKEAQAEAEATAKAALLAKLGITADEAKLLLG